MSNSVLQTFVLLFKGDNKQALSAAEELDKKIEGFRAKGKKRSADEEKEMKEAIKQRKALNEHLKETENTTKKLIESATQAAAAYISFAAIKSGILNAQQLNRELTIQANLWGTNSGKLAAYNALFQRSGGGPNDATSWYAAKVAENSANGITTEPLDKLLLRVSRKVKGLTPAAANQIFGYYGINSEGMRSGLLSGEYEKEAERQKKLTDQMEAAGPASTEFGKAVDDLHTSMTNLWAAISTDVLPTLTELIKGLTDLAHWLANNKEIAEGLIAVLTVGSLGLSKALTRLVFGFSTVEAGALGAARGILRMGGAILRFLGMLGLDAALFYGDAKGLQAIVDPSTRNDSWIGRVSRKVAGWIDPDVAKWGKTSGGGSAVDDWIKMGWSPEQAAGWAANEGRESGGNPRALGDGGHAVGGYQWHPDRAAAILRDFGIDVRTASISEQRRAANLEARKMGINPNTLPSSAGEAGAYISRRFERPAAGDAEAMIRARMAIGIVSSSPFSSQGSAGSGGQTVNVGRMEIHTQATNPEEIMRIARREFKNIVSSAHAQYNDSVHS